MSAEFQVQLPTALVQLEAYYAANWAVTDWYIDGTVGNDSNNGTSAATPLKTGKELRRRLGPYADWTHSVTIHVLANGMIDPLVVRGGFNATTLHLDVVGTPTLLASDTISSYLALNHATPRATEIVGTAITDFTPYVGQRVRIPSGARAGWTTWIAKASPNGVGLNTARVSPGIAINTVSTSTIFQTSLVPSATDPLLIESLPSIPQIVIDLDGTIAKSGGAQWSRRMYSVDSVACDEIYVRCSGADNLSAGVIFGSRVSNICCPAAHSRDLSLFAVFGCVIGANYGPQVFVKTPVIYCLFLSSGTYTVGFADRAFAISNSLIQGASIICSFAAYVSNVQIFDNAGTSPGSLYVLDSVIISTISGDQNAIGFDVRNGAKIAYGGTVNLRGTIACRLASTPTINLTAAQFFQPNDYAQKGSATLVGGTVTVTVPWYENTIQNVVVTRKVAGGTIGDLTVSQISTTQFTITSSSALDTSTVNWQISPLGRGINVASYA